MKEEKGKWEKVIHSKLYDFETDVNPDDWELISGRLSGGTSVRLHPYRRYISVAAAAVAVLLIAGGIWFYPYPDSGRDAVAVTEPPALSPDTDEPVRDVVEEAIPVVEKSAGIVEKPVDKPVKKGVVPVEAPVDNSLIASGRHPEKRYPEQRDTFMTTDPPVRLRPLEIDEADAAIAIKTDEDVEDGKDENSEPVRENESVRPEVIPYEEPFIADASAEVKKRRRWGFGMGGGSYSMTSSSGSTAPLTLSSLELRDEGMLKEVMNQNSNSLKSNNDVNYSGEGLNTYAYEVPPGKVKHKAPISAGLGISYFLNDRWSLQSGVTYTFLRSEWDSDHLTDNYAEYKQNLHFIGIPLSVSYKIVEWNRFQLYASAGGMCEFNVAGKYKETIFSENLEKISNKNLHMKKPMWSVNTRAGIAYPLWRFINAYAEAGASYYFDNQSDIETIRSDKPFNVSLQAGIRLGF